MTITKERIKEIATTVGTTYVEKPSAPAEISSLRSRLWQAAKRNNTKVSCTIEGDRIAVMVTSQG
jgi:hypothetical protein